MDNLKEKTAKGLFWGALNNGTTQVLNLVFGIVLGRLLTPHDYGIVGVLAVFTALAGCLQASGFTQGLINLKQPTARDYNSVFWFNVLASVVLYALLFLCAPLIAGYFKQPCLVDVSRVVFLSLPISALGITLNGYMLKNMMNRELAIVAFLSLLASGTCGVTLAVMGYSYWSLVWQQLTYVGMLNIGRCYYVGWRPSLHVDFGPVRQMFGFSSKLLVTSIVNTLNQHMLTFVFGRLFPMHAVGNFTQANKWSGMAHSTISGSIGQIAQPVLVSVADERDRQVRVFRKMMRFTAFLVFPSMFGLALVAREFILLTIGDQWSDCVVLLQILCVGGAFIPFHVLYQNLAISNGRSNVYMWSNIAQIAVQLLLILLLYRRGIIAIVWAYSAVNIVWMLVWHVIGSRLIGLRLADMLKDTLPFMLSALLVMAVARFVTGGVDRLVPLLVLRMLVAAVMYYVVMRVAGAKVMSECLHFILGRRATS